MSYFSPTTSSYSQSRVTVNSSGVALPSAVSITAVNSGASLPTLFFASFALIVTASFSTVTSIFSTYSPYAALPALLAMIVAVPAPTKLTLPVVSSTTATLLSVDSYLVVASAFTSSDVVTSVIWKPSANAALP